MTALFEMNFRIILIISLAFSLYHNHDVVAEQTLNIYADEISIDEANEKVMATGEAIVINESKTKIKSDLIIYNQKEKLLNADGNVIINDEENNTFFLESLSSSDDLNNINGKQVKVRLKDDSRIVGSRFNNL